MIILLCMYMYTVGSTQCSGCMVYCPSANVHSCHFIIMYVCSEHFAIDCHLVVRTGGFFYNICIVASARQKCTAFTY